MRDTIFVIVVVLALPNLIFSQEANEKAYPKYEIMFGVGRAKAFGGVTNLTDVPFNAKASPELALKAVIYRNINKNFSGGFHIYGYNQEVRITTTDSEGVSSTLSSELTSANVGLNGRWISRGKFSPYGFLALSFVAGQLDSTGFYGVSLGGGVGISLVLGSHFSVSLEGIVSAGYANVLEVPDYGGELSFPSFGPSTNASMAGVLVSISYLWGSL